MHCDKAGILLLLFIGLQLTKVNAANILAIFTTPTRSHHNWNSPLMVSLANRGHQVTIVSPIALKDPVPNITDIVLEGLFEVTEVHELSDFTDVSLFNKLSMFNYWYVSTCEKGLESNGGKAFIEIIKNTTFDLFIIEATGGECFLGFLRKFSNAPIVAVNGFGSPEWVHYNIGNPYNPSYVTSSFLNYIHPEGFLERLTNSLVYSISMLSYFYAYLPMNDAVTRKHLGDDFLSAEEILKNVSVVLVNSDSSFNGAIPAVPGLIPVGGIHIKKPMPLPKDIQSYLDDAKDGVIYFSLGSLVQSNMMSANKRQCFLDAFSELPQKVLWKWESDSLPGQPKNVKVSKWLPQNDILAHPNVRLFISHSGLLSTHEAIYHGVPIVGMPFIVDQYSNIQRVLSLGLGEKLDYNHLSKEIVLSAIRKVLEDPRYRENMKRISAQFRDQPQSPLERAVYWTEYVLRHEGAPHLRVASLDMTLYQYLLLDVLVFLLAVVTVTLTAIYLAVRAVIRRIGRKTDKLKRQ